MSFQNVAQLYLERGFRPFPVKGKRPPVEGATGRNGSVTPEQVAIWSRDPEWQNQNTALRHHLTVGIDVDHYGPKNGADQLAQLEALLGPLPATPSSTSRGADSPARQQFFALREPVLMQGKPPIPGVEKKENVHIDVIQASHRYSVVWPSVNPDAGNAPYLWYDAEGELMDGPPHVDDLEYLPEAWIDYLRVDDREYGHQAKQFDGDLPETASRTEDRKLRTIVTRLQGLPEVWSPGSGWHDTVFEAACWLWRIARSNAYAISPDEALQILLEHTPTYGSAWPVDRIIEQWESAEKLTVNQFEDPPEPELPPLLPWTGFPESAVFPEIQGQPFVIMWLHRPAEDALAEHRGLLLRSLLAAGIDATQAATLVWHCEAARSQGIFFAGQFFPDPHTKALTLEQLWQEVAAADAALRAPEPVFEAPVVLSTAELTTDAPAVALLTDEEREIARSTKWFGSSLIEWARKTFPHLNEPYYRANRWNVLSIIFGPKGVLPKAGGQARPVTLFQLTAGPTTSGKTEALGVQRGILKSYFLLADSPDIGGDHTEESLTQTLIERDGLASWFHVDEVHTVMETKWNKPMGPYSAIPGALTRLFDGQVDAIYRATKKEISGKAAVTYLTLHLMGTEDGLVNAIEPEDWRSGWMNRIVISIGQPPVRTRETVGGGWLGESSMKDVSEAAQHSHPMFAQWAAEFSAASQKVSRADGKPSFITIPDDVLRRQEDLGWELSVLARSNRRHADRLEPTFLRLAENALRCAALVALSQGRRKLQMSDLLIAWHQAEEWAQNAIHMVAATELSIRDRRILAIEKALIARGGVMTLVQINQEFPNQSREVDNYIRELVAKGRAEKVNTSGVESVHLRGATHV